MPPCPVNQRIPILSKLAVFRFTLPEFSGNGNTVTFLVIGSTLTIALSPPSVIQGNPCGPTITPCGAEPCPNPICSVLPEIGSSRPNSPDLCAVYHIDPFIPGATSCG